MIEEIREQLGYMEWLLEEEPAETFPNQMREAAYKVLEIVDKHEAQDDTPPPPRRTPHTPNGEIIHPRKCTECGTGMTEGYMAEDGSGTWCSDKCLFKHGYTKEQYQEDYEAGAMYYTAWEDEEALTNCEGWTRFGTAWFYDMDKKLWYTRVAS